MISHTRIYDASDERFTERLETYHLFRDDARFGDWQGYLARSDDFIRFCCHLHIAETLAAVAELAKREWCGGGRSVDMN